MKADKIRSELPAAAATLSVPGYRGPIRTAACVVAVGVAIILRLTTGSTDPLASARATFRTAVDRREVR